MLILSKRLGELSFGGLMAVYAEENAKTGRKNWPEEPEMRQLALAEEEFYNYLAQVFFTTPGAVYAVWEAGGQYVSALRLEPYREGLLAAGLVTRPDVRSRGYGTQLLTAVSERQSERIYAHVAKGNAASLRLHEKCGFQKTADHAVYVDGSVDDHCITLVYEKTQPSE